MSNSFARLLSACCLLLTAYCLTGCANIVPLEGGEKDTQPPQLDTLASTKNLQTRFQKQTIELAFLEWVELRDAFNQIVISPPLEFRPTIERKKKSIVVEFDEREVLRENATYVINFGQAIRDLTEGNAAPIQFVFSTGEFIDSLTVTGNIADAYTGEPVKDVLFLLYENQADSVVRTERPFYFARTDQNGNFLVNNVKAGAFKAAALLDQNLNYRFDNDAEKIAFLDSTLTIADFPKGTPSEGMRNAELRDSSLRDTAFGGLPLRDTTLKTDSIRVDSLKKTTVQATPNVSLRLFEEEKKLFLRGKETANYGQVKLAFNREPFEAKVTFDSVGQHVFLENERDTIRLWYHSERDFSWRAFVQRDTSIDTVLVKTGLREKFFAVAALKAVALPKAAPPEKVAPEKPFQITLNQPLSAFDASKISLLEDSTKTVVTPEFVIDPAFPRRLSVKKQWKEGAPYELQILPGGLTDIFGLLNADTIIRRFSAALKKDFGTLTLVAKDLKPDRSYVVRVLEKPDSPPIQTFQVEGQTEYKTTIPLLPPAIYTIEIIEDFDRNGRWTTGNYDLHRQPEIIARKKLEQLRANWELEAEVSAVPVFGSPAVESPEEGGGQPGGRAFGRKQ